MRRSLATVAVVLLVLVAGLALLYAARALVPPTAVVSSSPSVTSTATAVSATTTPSAIATPTSSSAVSAALPGAERFAVIVDKPCAPPGTPPYLRREDRHEVIAPLGNGYLCQLNGAVSPDGRRLAYWHFDASNSELALYQGGASSTTLVRLGDEFVRNVVWSADGAGLLFVAMKGGMQGVAPEYAALRTLDLASGSIQELTRVRGPYLTALAWDRSNRVTAAVETPASGGGGGAYLVVTEARVVKRSDMPTNLLLTRASPDATLIMALSQPDGVIRYWPIANFDDQKELRAAAGSYAGIAAWRPGARELAVVVTTPPGSQAVELWSLDGTRRRLVEFSGQRGGLFFRPDGSALFIGGGTGVDVASGRVALFTLAQGEGLAASLLVAPTLSRGVCTIPGMTTAQVLDRYLELTTSGDDAAVRDCFARSWLTKHGSANAWSSAGPRSRTDITPVGPFRNCNYYVVRADFVNGNPNAPVQSGAFAQFIGIGPEGDRPRIYEMATAMVSRELENDPGVAVPYCRD
jgi:hypothetical protein